MKTGRILRLYLAGDWPRQAKACPWALLTAEMRVVERGVGDASQWPASDECEAVLTADQVSWLSITLPEKLGRDASQIIAYALEEKLLQPIEAMHFVVPKVAERGARSAIVIGRTRLTEILDAMSACGRRLDRLFSEMQLVPSTAGQWTVCRNGAAAFLRIGAHLGLAVDWTGAEPPDALLLAIARARAAGDLPERLVVSAPAELAPDLAAWSSALGVPVTAAQVFDPLVASVECASNLLTGPFAPSGKAGFTQRALRLSVIALLLAGVCHTLLSLADWAWLAHQASTLRAEATSIYREAVPDRKAPLLNPSLQLQRDVGSALRARGRLGSGDMLTMLALLSSELPPEAQARRIRFDRSGLEVISVLSDESVRLIDSALRLRGYAVEATALRQDAAGTEYRIRMYLR